MKTLGVERSKVTGDSDPHTDQMSFILLHMVTGMCTEAGEVVELIRDHTHYGNGLNVTKLKDELGDLFFYLCGAVIDSGMSIQELLDAMGGPLFPSLAGFYHGGSYCQQMGNGYYNVKVGEVSPRLLDATMGLVITTSHMVDLLKKHMAYHRDLDFTKIKQELGFTLVHLADACMELGSNFDEIVAMNTAKLRKRYPNGYSHTNANNRDRKAEDAAQHEAMNVNTNPPGEMFQTPVEKVTNVDGERVVKGSEKDDRWGPNAFTI